MISKSVEENTEINGFVFDHVIGEDIDGSIGIKASNYKRQSKTLKIMSLKSSKKQEILSKTLLQCNIKHPNFLNCEGFVVQNKNSELILLLEDYSLKLSNSLHSIREPYLICKDITTAILYLKTINIIHGNIFPQNVYINDKKAKLSVFYVEKHEKRRDYYIAPQLRNGEEKTREGDIWSLGVTFLEILQGKRIDKLLNEDLHKVKTSDLIGCIEKIKSSVLKQLIKGMIVFVPSERLPIEEVYSCLISHSQVAKKNKVISINKYIYRQKFLNVKILNLSKVNLHKIQILDIGDQLQWLYLGQNSLTKIQNLQKFKKLKGLDLSHNKITRIQNLEQLAILQQLYLHNNYIKLIQNLSANSNLQILILFCNLISQISNLDGLAHLSALDLSKEQQYKGQNKIDRFEEKNKEKIEKLKQKEIKLLI